MMHLFGYPTHNQRDLVFAAALGFHGEEFILPLLETACCCRCGVRIDEGNSGWHSFQTLQLDGQLAGFALLIHCRDCPPEKLLPELKAIGTWPVTSDEWKFTQGEKP